MSNNKINEEEVLDLFKLLNENLVDYIILRDVNKELPANLDCGKDIDLLINRSHKEKIITTLLKNKWEECWHPWDFGNNFIFLYAMDPFLMFKKNNIHVDLAFQLSCRSLNNKEWFPLDKSIQESCFSNKRIIENSDLKYRLSYEDEFIHLLTRCIFDKNQFDEFYIKRLDELKNKIDLNNVIEKLEKVFFKFSYNLVDLIKKSDYKNIYWNYITFVNY